MRTTSDQVIDILYEAGVRWACGVPGDATDLMLASIHERKDFDFYLTRHEEAAGFMVSAFAKLTGKMGVVLACQGPGSAHMLNAMYDAKMDKVPMLVITGQIESDVIGTNTVQEINQLLLFDDVAEFNREVRTANNLVDVLQLAVQSAISKRCVAHVSISTDVLREHAVPRMPSPAVFDMKYTVSADESLIAKAADCLNKHDDVAILYGGGSIHAVCELAEIAKKLNAPLVHTVRSKDIIDNYHSHYVGGIGFKGSKNGCDAVKNCKALLVVGCSFAWREFYPTDVPIIQIDNDPLRVGVRCSVEVGLIGDAKDTLSRLLSLINQKSDNKFLKSFQAKHAEAIVELDKKAHLESGERIPSPVLTHQISQQLEDDAIVTVDAGTVSVWANNWLRLNGKQRLIGSTELGTLGFGMPAAIGCQLANPGKQVVALCGDGGFQMTVGDFSTAVKYDLPITVVIFNNFAYHFIELEQMKEGVAQCYTKLNNPDYAKMAESFGGEGFTVTKVEDIDSALERAFASPKPCIVDVHTQVDELIQPTKLTASMVWSFAKGMLKTKLSSSND